ncbi:translation initiation factor IF-2-like [Canis lupus familiaris]|uniref:translation initiation factor IF-2-like n=1 Tax=Canis lupus familiaris TaxID=9615 RepID=UPI0018F358EE|nr:translation initiation factor IF-2-like [Canis lupus familiaris]XP_038439900.1 translation initiation factor IF-2-like [Canis lupus familiaris]
MVALQARGQGRCDSDSRPPALPREPQFPEAAAGCAREESCKYEVGPLRLRLRPPLHVASAQFPAAKRRPAGFRAAAAAAAPAPAPATAGSRPALPRSAPRALGARRNPKSLTMWGEDTFLGSAGALQPELGVESALPPKLFTRG